jgi:hypothetical protein
MTSSSPARSCLIVTACVEKKRELRPQRVGDLMEALDALAASAGRSATRRNGGNLHFPRNNPSVESACPRPE